VIGMTEEIMDSDPKLLFISLIISDCEALALMLMLMLMLMVILVFILIFTHSF
jgi:hypothetical protein